MAVGQDVYTERILPGLPGMLHGRGHQIETLFVESGVVPFGYGVIAGTKEQDAVLPSSVFAVADFRGVARRNPNIERLYKSEDDPVYSAEFDPAMDVVKLRSILVIPTTVVLRDDPVWLHHTANGLKLPGTFSNAQDSTNNVDISAVAKWFRGNQTIGAVAALQLHIT